MAVATTCPSCMALFRLPDEMAGKKVRCQKCQALFVVPSSDGNMTVPGTSVPGQAQPTSEAEAPANPPSVAEETKPAEPPVSATAVTVTPKAKPISAALDEATASKDSAPPPLSPADETARPSIKKRRRPTESSSTAMTALIAVAVAGGVLSCCACSGVGAWLLILRSDDAKPAPVAVNNVKKAEVKKQIDFPKNDANKIDIPPAKIKLPPPQGGVTLVAFGPDGTFRSNGFLTQFEPQQPIAANNPELKRYKVFQVQMEAGKLYDIDMISNDFDSYLHLVDDANVQLGEDDDGGENLNAYIFFQPQRSGVYRIFAASFANAGVGNFQLVVRRR